MRCEIGAVADLQIGVLQRLDQWPGPHLGPHGQDDPRRRRADSGQRLGVPRQLATHPVGGEDRVDARRHRPDSVAAPPARRPARWPGAAPALRKTRRWRPRRRSGPEGSASRTSRSGRSLSGTRGRLLVAGLGHDVVARQRQQLFHLAQQRPAGADQPGPPAELTVVGTVVRQGDLECRGVKCRREPLHGARETPGVLGRRGDRGGLP